MVHTSVYYMNYILLQYADLSQEEVKTRTLWVSVWDWNRYGRQQFLGEVCIPLNGRDLTNPKNEWFQLRDSEVRNHQTTGCL